ncbi:ImmA/IrrE family metallo-endopeptidase [Rhodobacter sp. Har01]|uniref:ImmA/IrrE family metallo-endopeptidase n=1 Tax=Rhodobacter sp. Har01 TaxID=2883999 RepID=UPI001D076F3D|nr:ImmA/IrrE family metallo-endopeptidase [Rhodobacter sp. Har01]MCB6180205.1 ImmA/IrrE family metallo-endopeptidase [Rhodobacter sp. Har01]
MNTDFVSFGDPNRFEIAMRWRKDAEPRIRRPAHYGWSIGDLRLTVGGTTLTGNANGQNAQSFVSWYLLPIAQWFADNWQALLHQADFPWHESSSAPAVTVVGGKLMALIDARDEQGREEYRAAQAWRNAHAMNSASNGGLLPDLFLRRYLDTIEMSWTGRPPLFAPDQFRFSSGRGLAYLAVRDVAIPLWESLEWVAESGKENALEPADRIALAKLASRLEALQQETVISLTAHRIGSRIAKSALAALRARGLEDRFLNDNERVSGVPAVARFSPAVAMFGGLSPDLTESDVITLSDVIAHAYRSDQESALLTELVSSDGGPPIGAPHAEGYEWASDLLEKEFLGEIVSSFVDVEMFLIKLGVSLHEVSLETESIRGVALAGDGLVPTIVVNKTSVFNVTPSGRRFTLAHEMCHLFYDRTLAKGVGISSGPWAPAGVEKRANAFAAMFLMPRHLVVEAFGYQRRYNEFASIATAAERLQVGPSALVEHLYNLNLIDETDREKLRISAKGGQ